MRTRSVLLAAVASAAVGGAALAVTHNGAEAVAKVELTKVQMASARAADTGAPTVLPAIAHMLSETGDAKAPGAVFRQYSLDGAANASNVTPQALLLSPKDVHPDTQLSISFVPGLTHPDVSFDSEFFTTSTADVNGVVATVTVTKNGLGVERVDWVDAAGNYHVVMTERLRTTDGLSGLDVDTLLAIARSIGG